MVMIARFFVFTSLTSYLLRSGSELRSWPTFELPMSLVVQFVKLFSLDLRPKVIMLEMKSVTYAEIICHFLIFFKTLLFKNIWLKEFFSLFSVWAI
jgi:hypothetical protein